MKKQIYKPFQSLLLPRRYLQTRNNVSQPSEKWGLRQWVISRSLSLYRLFVMADIPPAERKNALNLRIQQWSPFAETGRYIVWHKDMAQVWIWDDTARINSMNAVKKNFTRIFPETLLHQPPNHDSLLLIAAMEGIEAQIWKSGVLIGSHWWQNEPTRNEWRRFLLAHDLNPDIKMPDATETIWLNAPWAKTSEDSFFHLRHERLWVSLTMMILTFLLIWQGVNVWRWHQAEMILQERVARLTQEAEPLLNARNQAMAYKDTAEKLISLTPYPAQLVLMAAVAEKLPEQTRLMEWHYQQGALTFRLQGKNPDPRYFVEAYQKLPYFKDVTAERGYKPDELVVKMNLVN